MKENKILKRLMIFAIATIMIATSAATVMSDPVDEFTNLVDTGVPADPPGAR